MDTTRIPKSGSVLVCLPIPQPVILANLANLGLRTAQTHSSNGDLTPFSDSSQPLFSMYSKVAEEEDNKVVARWQKDAEGILIFVGPFVPIYLRTLTKSI